MLKENVHDLLSFMVVARERRFTRAQLSQVSPAPPSTPRCVTLSPARCAVADPSPRRPLPTETGEKLSSAGTRIRKRQNRRFTLCALPTLFRRGTLNSLLQRIDAAECELDLADIPQESVEQVAGGRETHPGPRCLAPSFPGDHLSCPAYRGLPPAGRRPSLLNSLIFKQVLLRNVLRA